jgi:hypothetical protein
LRPPTHFASESTTTRPALAGDPAQDGEAAKIDSRRTRKMVEARLFDLASSHSGASIVAI